MAKPTPLTQATQPTPPTQPTLDEAITRLVGLGLKSVHLEFHAKSSESFISSVRVPNSLTQTTQSQSNEPTLDDVLFPED
jgi:hypothetical protein